MDIFPFVNNNFIVNNAFMLVPPADDFKREHFLCDFCCFVTRTKWRPTLTSLRSRDRRLSVISGGIPLRRRVTVLLRRARSPGRITRHSAGAHLALPPQSKKGLKCPSGRLVSDVGCVVRAGSCSSLKDDRAAEQLRMR